ncbi:MAG: hypothetical protein Q7R84_01815 [bacterium]|nr:hypothetical protein [bacterium]
MWIPHLKSQSAAEERQKREVITGFKETFWFELREGEKALPVHQLLVNMEIARLAREVEVADCDYKELGRQFLSDRGDRNVETFGTLGVVLDSMHRLDSIRTTAVVAFNEAVKLAREARFAVKGEVADCEVERIFGLGTTHRPLTEVELKRINAVLVALAQAYEYAERVERDGMSHVSSVPTVESVKAQNDLRDRILFWRGRFWEAHGLAKKVGVKVFPDKDMYTNTDWRMYTSTLKMKEVIDWYIKQGVIRI